MFFASPPNSSLGLPEDVENVLSAVLVNTNTGYAKFLSIGRQTRYSSKATQKIDCFFFFFRRTPSKKFTQYQFVFSGPPVPALLSLQHKH